MITWSWFADAPPRWKVSYSLICRILWMPNSCGKRVILNPIKVSLEIPFCLQTWIIHNLHNQRNVLLLPDEQITNTEIQMSARWIRNVDTLSIHWLESNASILFTSILITSHMFGLTGCILISDINTNMPHIFEWVGLTKFNEKFSVSLSLVRR